MKFVVAVYSHPEYYPPTLNAIDALSEISDKIWVLSRNVKQNEWKYPGKVEIILSGKFRTITKAQNASILWKLNSFLQFTVNFYKLLRRHKPQWVICYDPIPLLSFRCASKFLFYNGSGLWYHNHDVVELNLIRKYSIAWFAAKSESKIFQEMDIFSLPSHERLAYFPMNKFKGHYFFIPNYPSKKFYNQFYNSPMLGKKIRIIFQGQVGPCHGIEEIIPLLKNDIEGYQLELVLKGPCSEKYRRLYLDLAKEYHVSNKLIFKGVTSYAEVPLISSQCHIGIGIHAKKDIMNTTLGTASNKLYEYAAVGLPVIYYNSKSFTKYLANYPWAVASDLNEVSIKNAIISISKSYNILSATAHKDFLENLNFEKAFDPVFKYLKGRVKNA